MLDKQTVAFFLLFTMLFWEASCLRHSSHIKLSGPLEVGDQWLELHTESPLRADKDFQWVQLELEPPFKDDMYNEGKGPDKGLGVLMPNGDVTNPEIELVVDRGTVYKLVYHGSRSGAPVYGTPESRSLPRDRPFQMVRIRSSNPFKCKAVYWFSESSKDWK